MAKRATAVGASVGFRLVAEHPAYVSVECFHELHSDCRGDCRYCATPCRCACHRHDPLDDL